MNFPYGVARLRIRCGRNRAGIKNHKIRVLVIIKQRQSARQQTAP